MSALLCPLWRTLTGGGRFSAASSAPFRLLYAAGAHQKIRYLENVGIPEFLKAVGNGVETHVDKLEKGIGDFEKLLVTRTLRLKKLGLPCKHRKLILKYTHKYRLGLWRPRADLPNPTSA